MASPPSLRTQAALGAEFWAGDSPLAGHKVLRAGTRLAVGASVIREAEGERRGAGREPEALRQHEARRHLPTNPPRSLRRRTRTTTDTTLNAGVTGTTRANSAREPW